MHLSYHRRGRDFKGDWEMGRNVGLEPGLIVKKDNYYCAFIIRVSGIVNIAIFFFRVSSEVLFRGLVKTGLRRAAN